MKTKRIFFGLAFISVILVASAQGQNIASSVERPGMEDAIVNVARIVGSAVVSISTQSTAKTGVSKRYYFRAPFGEESPFGGQDEFFRKFFDDFFGEMPEQEFKQSGLGSGVIIDQEGHILTNEHVVGDADKITVTLPDGREFKGEIKGKDRRSDLAVIKINAKNLPVAQIGDSDNLKIGQWVVAIGNPFGFALENPEPTVTVGVISALHRSLGRVFSREKDFSDLIQTDAAINPGNSGGPLVNLKGEIVGVNVAIFSTTGGYQGVGFAIPVNRAKKIIAQLIAGKKILYGWLGVIVQDLTDDLAGYFGLADKNGVLVAKVIEDGPAQKAGLKESDVIKQIDAKAVNNVKELLSIVGNAEVGKKVKVQVVREKKQLTLEVQLGERPESLGEGEEKTATVEPSLWRGLEAMELPSENARRFGMEGKKGIVAAQVESDSPADEAGLIPGDLILEINKQPVKTMADYEKITKGIKGNALIKTERGFFVVKESEK